jgi:hypothetical protein
MYSKPWQRSQFEGKTQRAMGDINSRGVEFFWECAITADIKMLNWSSWGPESKYSRQSNEHEKQLPGRGWSHWLWTFLVLMPLWHYFYQIAKANKSSPATDPILAAKWVVSFCEGYERTLARSSAKWAVCFLFFNFFYSYVHTMFGSLLPPSPHPLPSPPPSPPLPPCCQAETILPLSLILLKREYKQ